MELLISCRTADIFIEANKETDLAGGRGCICRWDRASAGPWGSPGPAHVWPWMASGPGRPPARFYGPRDNSAAAAERGRSRTSWPAGSAGGRRRPVGFWDWDVPAKKINSLNKKHIVERHCKIIPTSWYLKKSGLIKATDFNEFHKNFFMRNQEKV